MIQPPQFGMTTGLRVWMLSLTLCLCGVLPASAQSVWGKVGTSTLMQASGFQMDYKLSKWTPMQGWLGLGHSDSFDIGGYVQTRTHGYEVGLGDRYIPFVLSTDVFDQSRYFSARGGFLHRSNEKSSWLAFGGATSGEVSYSFYHAYVTEDPAAGFIYEHKLGDRVTLQSYNFFQREITSLQSLKFDAAKDLTLGISTGVGNSDPVFSVAGDYFHHWLRVTSSYTASEDTFRRISGVSSMAAERTGLNVRAMVQPWRRFQLTGGHENLISPVLKKGDVPKPVSLDSVSAAFQVEKFRLGTAFSASSSGPLTTRTESYSVSRQITSSISATGSIFRFHTSGLLTKSWVTSVQENLSPRLNIYQGLSHSGNANSVVWGARVLSNRMTVGIEQNVIYSPLAGGFSGKQYMQTWTVNLNVPLVHGIRAHADTYLDATGRMRYTTWADGIGFSRDGEQNPASSVPNVSLGRFIVKGRVIDSDGKPVWGIAIQVDGKMTYSDSSGQFFLRFRRGETYPLTVLIERSLNRTSYVVVQAPVTALADPESVASEIVIVVRPVTPISRLRSPQQIGRNQ